MPSGPWKMRSIPRAALRAYLVPFFLSGVLSVYAQLKTSTTFRHCMKSSRSSCVRVLSQQLSSECKDDVRRASVLQHASKLALDTSKHSRIWPAFFHHTLPDPLKNQHTLPTASLST